MKKLSFDTGIQEYKINGSGILRFNPSDPNVYARFSDSQEMIQKLGEEYEEKTLLMLSESDDTSEIGIKITAILRDIDVKIKKQLQYVFGKENDFDEILEGINLYAPAGNGQMVLTNLLNALKPIINDGIKKYAESQADEAIKGAKLNREQRRAAVKVVK